jgi:hypothetical protein
MGKESCRSSKELANCKKWRVRVSSSAWQTLSGRESSRRAAALSIEREELQACGSVRRRKIPVCAYLHFEAAPWRRWRRDSTRCLEASCEAASQQWLRQ